MEQIKILFFVIGSFFGMENGKIAADKTTVTISPQTQEVDIVQEGLFTVIQTESDKALVLEQWDKLYDKKETNTTWAKDLDSFPQKAVTYKTSNNSVHATIRLKYTTERDLRAMGIWYNKENEQFSINHSPQQHLKTEDGILDGNYWVFKDDKPFSFTLEPFLELPEQYAKMIKTIDELLKED